jgi:hypothetical protein
MLRSVRLPFFALLSLLTLSGCTTVGDQIVPTTLYKTITLKPGALQQYGLAFMTPSTVTGQEQDRQALALIFAEMMYSQKPDVKVTPLSETLGRINRTGLADEYRRMFEDYRETGIFQHEGLLKVGQAVGARYFAQLKLAGFSQTMFERFSLLGFRLFQTQYANIRLYLQIWDSAEGTIAWEGSEEMSYAYDSSAEKPVTFRMVVEEAARQLIANIP